MTSQKDVLTVQRGKIERPQKAVIYGPEGVGKSTPQTVIHKQQIMTDSKTSLTPARQHMIAEMQRINYGRIENLTIRQGQPVFSPSPRVIREFKFGADNGPRPELEKSDYRLKLQVLELFVFMEAMGEGIITTIEIQRGLPFRMTIEEVHA